MKIYVLLACIALPILVLAVSCSQVGVAHAEDVTLEQLFGNPDKYTGRNVTTEGFYFSGFETIVLTEKLECSGYADGHLIPEGNMIWIEGGLPQELYADLHHQSMMGPTERYGKIRITGKFEYGEKYGHLGGYEYQISPAEIEVLPWSPEGASNPNG